MSYKFALSAEDANFVLLSHQAAYQFIPLTMMADEEAQTLQDQAINLISGTLKALKSVFRWQARKFLQCN